MKHKYDHIFLSLISVIAFGFNGCKADVAPDGDIVVTPTATPANRAIFNTWIAPLPNKTLDNKNFQAVQLSYDYDNNQNSFYEIYTHCTYQTDSTKTPPKVTIKSTTGDATIFKSKAYAPDSSNGTFFRIDDINTDWTTSTAQGTKYLRLDVLPVPNQAHSYYNVLQDCSDCHETTDGSPVIPTGQPGNIGTLNATYVIPDQGNSNHPQSDKITECIQGE